MTQDLTTLAVRQKGTIPVEDLKRLLWSNFGIPADNITVLEGDRKVYLIRIPETQVASNPSRPARKINLDNLRSRVRALNFEIMEVGQ